MMITAALCLSAVAQNTDGDGNADVLKLTNYANQTADCILKEEEDPPQITCNEGLYRFVHAGKIWMYASVSYNPLRVMFIPFSDAALVSVTGKSGGTRCIAVEKVMLCIADVGILSIDGTQYFLDATPGENFVYKALDIQFRFVQVKFGMVPIFHHVFDSQIDPFSFYHIGHELCERFPGEVIVSLVQNARDPGRHGIQVGPSGIV